MRLEELKVYQMAMEIGEEVWELVQDWNYFAKDTVGKQFVRAADGIGSNISEGFGRFHYKDAKLFYYYARGSLYETKTWLKKANKRKLIMEEKFFSLENKLDYTCATLNNYIKSVDP